MCRAYVVGRGCFRAHLRFSSWSSFDASSDPADLAISQVCRHSALASPRWHWGRRELPNPRRYSCYICSHVTWPWHQGSPGAGQGFALAMDFGVTQEQQDFVRDAAEFLDKEFFSKLEHEQVDPFSFHYDDTYLRRLDEELGYTEKLFNKGLRGVRWPVA